MYVKCGCLDSARGIFDTMGVRDVLSWTRMSFNEMPERNVVSWSAMNLVSESIETTPSLQNTTNQCDHSKRVHLHVLLNVGSYMKLKIGSVSVWSHQNLKQRGIYLFFIQLREGCGS